MSAHRAMTECWTLAVADATNTATVRAWSQRHPSLAGVQTLDDLVLRAQGRTSAESRIYRGNDDACHALLTELHSGSELAGVVLLQVLRPWLRRISRRTAHRFGSADDAASAVTEAMWTLLTQFDLTRRTATISTTLGMQCLNAVAGRQARREAPVEELATAEVTVNPEPSGHPFGATGEVLELLAWASHSEVISTDEAALLTRVYAPDPALPEFDDLDGGRFQERVAAELGISHPALRQRASRAVRKIRSAVLAHAELATT